MRQHYNQSVRMTFPGLAQAVRVGEFLVLSGQTALDDAGNLVGSGNAATQAEQCFANIQELLTMAGGSWADVVQLTCYLTDRAHYPAYAEAKLRHLGGHTPAGTAVIVAGLMRDDLLLEVEALAFVASHES